MIQIQKFRFNAFEENCYLVRGEEMEECVIIDPGFDTETDWEKLRGSIQKYNLRPVAALLTHAHPDHTYGVRRLCDEYDIPVYVAGAEKHTVESLPALCRGIGHSITEDFTDRIVWTRDSQHIVVDRRGARLEDEEVAEEGYVRMSGESRETGRDALDFKVLLTPGHSSGSVCYLCCGKVLFSGDTLFAGCIGRTDLVGGDYDALMQSIFTRILPLDGDTDVLPGHGSSTTVADERTKNPFLRPFNLPEES